MRNVCTWITKEIGSEQQQQLIWFTSYRNEFNWMSFIFRWVERACEHIFIQQNRNKLNCNEAKLNIVRTHIKPCALVCVCMWMVLACILIQLNMMRRDRLCTTTRRRYIRIASTNIQTNGCEFVCVYEWMNETTCALSVFVFCVRIFDSYSQHSETHWHNVFSVQFLLGNDSSCICFNIGRPDKFVFISRLISGNERFRNCAQFIFFVLGLLFI